MTKIDDVPPPFMGPYKILKSLGKGGMGQVYLAYDPICEREVALKCIRSHLLSNERIRNRFMREAKFIAKLSHPSIVPIYTMNQLGDEVYYTMPFIEGQTLRQILKTAQQAKLNEENFSIPQLLQIFLSVCHALEYAHSRGILHRDLKPDNIMVGKFGEVFVLDWGIAHSIQEKDTDEDLSCDFISSKDLTSPGKVVGTINYLAPERALKQPASVATDIYALGVILYQILTLELPFQRSNLYEFRRILKYEELISPEERAPYRDIPREIGEITKKCLAKDPAQRCTSIHDLIGYIQNYFEGRPEWMKIAELKIENKTDWEFQENVLLTQHVAITRMLELVEWVVLMISKQPFPGHARAETSLTLFPDSLGVGILMNIPEVDERESLESGYCLWLGSHGGTGCTLFRSNVEVMSNPNVGLKIEKASSIMVEKIERHVKLYVDGVMQMHYVSYIPLLGTHIGLVYKDTHFQIEPLSIFTGSQNLQVSCLAVPDAFFALKQYERAFSEYERISRSFPGRKEGQEALFRAGITLLENGKKEIDQAQKNFYFEQALDKFEQLRLTPAAPLEYLGKSFVYETENNIEEEVKCLELAFWKYPQHPLLPTLGEHIGFRLHQTAARNRKEACRFALLALMKTPKILRQMNAKELIKFLIPAVKKHTTLTHLCQYQEQYFTITMMALLSFVLGKITLLSMVYDEAKKKELEPGCLSCLLLLLLEIGADNLVEEKLGTATYLSPFEKELFAFSTKLKDLPLEKKFSQLLKSVSTKISFTESKVLLFILKKALGKESPKILLHSLTMLETYLLDESLYWDHQYLIVSILLLNRKWDQARDVIKNFAIPILPYDMAMAYYLKWLLIFVSEGSEEAKLLVLDDSLDSRQSIFDLIISHIQEKMPLDSRSLKQSFWYERILFFQQMQLLHIYSGSSKKAELFLIKQEEEMRELKNKS